MYVRRDLPAQLARVVDLSADVHAACQEAGLDEMAVMDLELAVAEAANNIIVHGYEGDASKSFSVLFEAAKGRVKVALVDQGRPIPPNLLDRIGEVSEEAESGRGLMLIRQCVDEMRYASAGGENRLELGKGRAG